MFTRKKWPTVALFLCHFTVCLSAVSLSDVSICQSICLPVHIPLPFIINVQGLPLLLRHDKEAKRRKVRPQPSDPDPYKIESPITYPRLYETGSWPYRTNVHTCHLSGYSLRLGDWRRECGGPLAEGQLSAKEENRVTG